MSEKNNIRKKVVIVTGSSQGLGSEIAKRFASEEYYVIVNYKTKEEGACKTLNDIKAAGGDGEIFKCDISNFSQTEDFIKNIYQKHKNITILVNNAGITEDALLLHMKEQEWDDVLSTNLKGVFNTCRAASPFFIKQNEGCIINISSLSGIEGRTGQINYAASKAAIIGFSKSLAQELGVYNIRVNVIIPGFLDTPMTSKLSELSRESIKKRNTLQTQVTPKDVSEFIYFLSHQRCISGQVFHVDNRISM